MSSNEVTVLWKMSLISMLDPFSLVLSFIFFVIFRKLLSKNEKATLINKIPGPRAYPFVGNIVELMEPKTELYNKILERRKQFGPMFRVWLGTHAAVIFSGAKDIEVLLRSSKHMEKAFSYKFLHPWLGTGLLTSHGRKWMTHRKLITPTFHFKVLQSFVDVFQRNANILASKLREKAKTGEQFDIYPFVTLCALDIICETAMGTKINAQSETQNEYVKSVYRLSALIVYRMNRVWLHPDLIFGLSESGREYQKHLETVQNFTKNVIKNRKEALKAKDNAVESDHEERKLTFLDLLLESSTENGSVQMTDEELREEVDTFMFEGHDTTAAGMNWTLFMLGNHPQIQEMVYEELKTIFEFDSDRVPTMTDLAEMKLLERVIKESLRLFPSVPSIGRILEEDVQFGSYLVPKGTNAVINVFALHKDPEHYPNPEVFDPDRFLPENTLKRHPYSYIPFSAGPRNCIGQKFALLEEKIVLSTLIRNFKFVSMEKPENVTKIPELILRPLSGVKVKISKR